MSTPTTAFPIGTARRAPAGPLPWVVTAMGVAVWAALSSWWMPRGPTSTTESLACVALGLALGLAGGYFTRSRWAVVVLPMVFVVVYELARLRVDGPTVDGVGLSEYGLIALVTGRVFHGLVALAPLAWGAAAGAAAWRRTARSEVESGRRAGRWGRRAALATSGLALVALIAVLARPASTAPVTGADGRPHPNSVAELSTVRVQGRDLGVMVRGTDRSNPVLLFLAGGPGGSELGAMRRHLPALEEYFTVVTWDQRGTGRSYGELDPVDTLTLDAAVADTIAVTDIMRDRFQQDRIYLVGQSWGSTLGVLAVQRAPERYAAFVGVGQMVSQRATDSIFYDDTLGWAEASGRDDLAATLREIGPPPYADPRHYETLLSHEGEIYPYDHASNSEGAGQMSENLLVPEYSLTEQVRLFSGTLDTFAALYPQLQDIDFRQTATALEVPVFFVQGAHEARGRAELFADWYPRINAPVKDQVVLQTSGHRPLFEQPDAFVTYLSDVVLARTVTAAETSPGPAAP